MGRPRAVFKDSWITDWPCGACVNQDLALSGHPNNKMQQRDVETSRNILVKHLCLLTQGLIFIMRVLPLFSDVAPTIRSAGHAQRIDPKNRDRNRHQKARRLADQRLGQAGAGTVTCSESLPFKGPLKG